MRPEPNGSRRDCALRTAARRQARWYTFFMHRRRPIVLIAACLSLLCAQFGGIHMHVGAAGLDTTVHTHHIHGAGAAHMAREHAADDDVAGHDHAGDRDVFVELGANAAKQLLLFVLCASLGLMLLLLPSTSVHWPRRRTVRPQARHERWRPPLRAPPVLSR